MNPNQATSWILWGVQIVFNVTGTAALGYMIFSTWRRDRAMREDQAEWKAQHDRIEETIRSSLARLPLPRQPGANA